MRTTNLFRQTKAERINSSWLALKYTVQKALWLRKMVQVELNPAESKEHHRENPHERTWPPQPSQRQTLFKARAAKFTLPCTAHLGGSSSGTSLPRATGLQVPGLSAHSTGTFSSQMLCCSSPRLSLLCQLAVLSINSNFCQGCVLQMFFKRWLSSLFVQNIFL